MSPNTIDGSDDLHPENASNTIYDRFYLQSQVYPDKIAVCLGTSCVTYAELVEKSEQLASQLNDRGVGVGSLVGIHLTRSVEMLASTLAVLKLGAAFLPLDPMLPLERKQYILSDAAPTLCISDDYLTGIERECCFSPFAIEGTEKAYTATRTEQGGTAYVIYTSGSTGRPKGVTVGNDSLLHFFESVSQIMGLGDCERFVALTTFGFDISILELLLPLTIGGVCHIVTAEISKDADALRQVIEHFNPTILQATPSTFEMLLNAGWIPATSVQILCGGEAWSPALYYKLKSAAAVWNAYGPTEATIWTSLTKIDDSRDFTLHSSIPISSYFPGAMLIALDDNQKPVTVGETGELYIGGKGLALGYYKNAELTTQRFVDIQLHADRPPVRLYRTGDIVRVISNSEINYIGRTDNQLKIRGHRVEAGDIEHHLMLNPLVERCIVDIHTEGEQSHLIAWFKETNEQHYIGDNVTVDAWGQLYDETYREGSDYPYDFDTRGWNSAYTGKPIPKDQMKRWINHTVGRILGLSPKKIVEVGCGTGLIMYPLLRKGLEYIGLDLSATAIERHERQIEHHGFKKCQVFRGSAEQLESLPFDLNQYDTVVLNSVIQYFPDKRYLDNVIRTCAIGLKQGRIFIGDVIDFRLQGAYYTSLVRFNSAFEDIEKIKEEVAHKREHERELFVDPAYFLDLAYKIPEISGVELLPKMLDDANELSRYRYDVILHVSEAYQVEMALLSVAWTPGLDIAMYLCADHEVIKITGYPRKQVFPDYLLLNGQGQNETSYSAIFASSELLELATEYGYKLNVSLETEAENAEFFMTVCFSRNEDNPLLMNGALARRLTTNSPQENNLSETINIEELREYAKTVLPQYMCPDLYVRVSQFPLTANGKIDRKALPEPVFKRNGNEDPVGDTEYFLASCWARILQLDFIVSREDNFFSLGGQSLSATRLASEIKKKFGVSVSISELLQAATIVDQARLIEQHHSTVKMQLSRVEKKEYPLSSSQERLWFKNSLDSNSGVYHVQEIFNLKGSLNIPALNLAFNELIKRHETLRTTYHLRYGAVNQCILPFENQFVLGVYDLTSSQQDADGLATLLNDLRSASIDLTQALMLHASIIKLDINEFILAITYHHLAIDDWSLDIIHNELSIFYNAANMGQQPKLDAILLRYCDYADWQRSTSHDSHIAHQIKYWEDKLKGIPQLQTLHTDFVRPPEQSSHGKSISIVLSSSISSKFTRLCNSQGATLFMGMNALLAILLHRFGCGEDIVIGAPIANREINELVPVVGFFANTIALRTRLHDNLTFSALLSQCRRTALDAYKYQQVPFEVVAAQLAPERYNSFHPVFQTMLVIKNALSLPDLEHIEISEQRVPLDSCLFDLEMHVEERDGVIDIEWLYNTALFRRSTITQMSEVFESLLAQVITSPEQPIHTIDCVPLLSLPQFPVPDYSRQATVVELVMKQLAQDPHALAVVDGVKQYSYNALYSRACSVAKQLQQSGVKAGDCVAIAMDRSVDLISAVLGVWLANSAFLILDIKNATERLNYIVQDAAPVLILHRSQIEIPELGVETVAIIENKNREFVAVTAYESNLKSLAYINYTSGSTGQPKGVKVRHDNLASIVTEWHEVLKLSNKDRWLQMANASFDVFIADICRAFTSGASLVICPENAKIDPKKMLALCNQQNITIGDFVPAVARALADEMQKEAMSLETLRLMIVGSDSWNWADYRTLRKVLRDHTEVFNCYGTTETTIDNTWFRLPVMCPVTDGMIPIGTPYKNTQVYILDSYGNHCPKGVWGELHIGGKSVSEGYVNPELNVGRFGKYTCNQKGKQNLYSTGDIVRWNHQGQLELQGRADNQIKLRGYRIELEEVKTAFDKISVVTSAEVCFDSERQQIRAFVCVSDSNHEDALGQMREQLHSALPLYMHPATIDIVKEFPLTSNGKIDRKKLLSEYTVTTVSQKHRPLSAHEFEVASVWANVVKVPVSHIHPKASFFEIGGHSLLIYLCLAEIKHIFGVTLDARVFFELASLEKISAQIEKDRHSQFALGDDSEKDIGFFI
ncbi:non-ribosomal peptide synthetase [Dickeya zeae]|uniref:non-ribosomal peptide synthetase n=1 Tax=Dickeya zeae TaxID=204042 RepID=UPI0003A41379|nr:non-ribosomal peptide synthetase [Dickeya zeae]